MEQIVKESLDLLSTSEKLQPKVKLLEYITYIVNSSFRQLISKYTLNSKKYIQFMYFHLPFDLETKYIFKAN